MGLGPKEGLVGYQPLEPSTNSIVNVIPLLKWQWQRSYCKPYSGRHSSKSGSRGRKNVEVECVQSFSFFLEFLTIIPYNDVLTIYVPRPKCSRDYSVYTINTQDTNVKSVNKGIHSCDQKCLKTILDILDLYLWPIFDCWFLDYQYCNANVILE